MIRGSCLCGGVRYEIAGEVQAVTHCHCSMCRKAHGAAFATYVEADARDFHFASGDSLISRYRSSEASQRSFCNRCGSNLLFESDEAPNRVYVAAGGIDSELPLRPGSHIFVGSKAPWFDITDDLPRYETDSE